MKWFVSILGFLSLLFHGSFLSPVWGQASVNVPVLDLSDVYRDIDKLVAQGLIDKIIYGQKPYSRREIARLIAEAMGNLKRLEDPLADPATPPEKKISLEKRLTYVKGLLVRLERDYREELIQWGVLPGTVKWYSFHPLEKMDVDVLGSNSRPRLLNNDNGTGRIDAVINPLLQYRQGRHLVDGFNASLETTHWVRASRYFAAYFRPRFQIGEARAPFPDRNDIDILNLYGKFWVKNLEIQIGRDNLFYGQGEDAGILLSHNPRGLDMAKISNDCPFILPWVFKALGPTKMEFFYADLGPEQFFPHSYLAGFKLSFQPFRDFEFGLSGLDISGGEGSPPGSFLDRVGNVIPIVQFFGGSQQQIDNKLGGFDFRWRLPHLRGMEVYLEAIFDDTSNQFLWEDAGYILGFYLPRMVEPGKVDFRLELHHTGIRYYRHAQFQSGWTLNQFLIGDNLGPDANGAYFRVNWEPNSENRLGFNIAIEGRSNDDFINLLANEPNRVDFEKVQDFPDEWRYRLTSEWILRKTQAPYIVKAFWGYERVQNFNFVSGSNRNNFMGGVTLQLNLDKWTRLPRNY
jgi:hypothetical protein